MQPDILIVDEVLAVGDAQFQQKCFDKIREIQRGNRTILLVTHNMAAIRNICRRGIVLEHGTVLSDGSVNDVLDGYIARYAPTPDYDTKEETESFQVEEVRMLSQQGPVIKTYDPVEITVTFIAKKSIIDPGLYIGILSETHERLMGLDFKDFRTLPRISPGQRQRMGFVVESLPLLSGKYFIEVHLKDMAEERYEVVPRKYGFEIVETPVYGGRKLDHWFGHVGLKARPVVNDDGF